MASAPVVIGLIVIVIVFQSLNSTFLNPFNLVNLLLQIAALGILATGVTLVLMLGEIDLSIGSVSGVAAAILLVSNVRDERAAGSRWPSRSRPARIIGLIQGSIFAKVGVPSFIVTLAGLLTWQGVQLRILGKQGTINLPPNGPLVELAQFSLPAAQRRVHPRGADSVAAAGLAAVEPAAAQPGRAWRSARSGGRSWWPPC